MTKDLADLRQEVQALKQVKHTPLPPRHTPLNDFAGKVDTCRRTIYNWAEKGIVDLERIGGRVYVVNDSVKVSGKYQRK